MAVSILNANIERISDALCAIHAADRAVCRAKSALASAPAAVTSTANTAAHVRGEVDRAVEAVTEAALKSPSLSEALAVISALLDTQAKRFAEAAKQRHSSAPTSGGDGGAEGRMMAFFADYDVIPARTILSKLLEAFADGLAGAGGSGGDAIAYQLTTAVATTASVGGSNGASYAPVRDRFVAFIDSVAAHRSSSSSSNGSSSSSLIANGLAALAAIEMPANLRFPPTAVAFLTARLSSATAATRGSLTLNEFIHSQSAASYAPSSSAAASASAATGGALAPFLTDSQQTLVASQEAAVGKELELLEYLFGVARTRLARDAEEQRPLMGSTEAAVSEGARRVLYLSRSFLVSAMCLVADYYFRIGNYRRGAAEVRAAATEAASVEPARPYSVSGSVAAAGGSSESVPPEFFLSSQEYALLGGLKHSVGVAKVAIYHTFHTPYFVDACGGIVERALGEIRSRVLAPKGGGGAAASAPSSGGAGGAAAAGGGANAAAKMGSAESGGERFVRAINAYERHYKASRSSAVWRFGAPMPVYGLPDEEGAAAASSSSGAPAPILAANLAFDGADLISAVRFPTAFAPLTAPLFSVADYTLLAVAAFYLPLNAVLVDNRRALIAFPPTKAAASERRRRLAKSLSALGRLRLEPLTAGRYDFVKALMFGQYTFDFSSLSLSASTDTPLVGESIRLARARQSQILQDEGHADTEGDNASASTNGTSSPPPLTFSDPSPVLAEIAKISTVIAVGAMSRDELSGSFLALAEPQALLGAEAEAVEGAMADAMEAYRKANPNADFSSPSSPDLAKFVMTNPATGARVGTSGRAIAQASVEARYSDAVLGLTAAPNGILNTFFLTAPLLSALAPHARQEIREMMIRRMLQPYARIGLKTMAERLCLYSGPDPEGDLLEELKGLIRQGTLGPNVRIEWGAGGGSEGRSIVRIQNTYGGGSGPSSQQHKAQQLSAEAALYAYPRVDGPVLALAASLQSEVGASFQSAAERLARIASLRATGLDDVLIGHGHASAADADEDASLAGNLAGLLGKFGRPGMRRGQ